MIDHNIRVQRVHMSDLICTLDQWTEDYMFAACVQADAHILEDESSDTDELSDHFDRRYQANGRIQLLRVLAALRWVNEHSMEQLDAKYGAWGDNNFRVKKELASALYSAFANCPEEELETDFSNSWVLGFDTWKAAFEESMTPAEVSKTGEAWKQQLAQDGMINESIIEDHLLEIGESTESLIVAPSVESEDIDAQIEANRVKREKALERSRVAYQAFRKKACEPSCDEHNCHL
jgi:hypothetical protein